jgi:proline iminopeptidase
MTMQRVRDVSLFVDVIGHGEPLLLMHGGPGADHWTLLPLCPLSAERTLVAYDHRANGRSTGDETTLTWDNLTADADALREQLGFGRWAVLGHSFGGKVALEYALRYPDRVSALILLDTGGSSWWPQHNAPRLLAERGFDPKVARLAGRFLNGRVPPKAFMPTLMRLGKAYNPHTGLRAVLVELVRERHMRSRPAALVYAARHLLRGWTVMDRLGELAMPTLVIAGRDDFLFPPEHQAQLAAGIPRARLRIVERAGHNAHADRPDVVLPAIRAFLRQARADDPAVAGTSPAP